MTTTTLIIFMLMAFLSGIAFGASAVVWIAVKFADARKELGL